MKRFRASVFTGFIACGLLCLNLLGFAFSVPADSLVATAAAAPADENDSDTASDAASVCVLTVRRETVARRQQVALRQEHASRVTTHFLPDSRHASRTWQFSERAAASPRAPALTA